MGLLNLLTTYQKKHLVEFLPYHECDNQSRQAPDLECLIKLQAQHTQQRHLIFLTGIIVSDIVGSITIGKINCVSDKEGTVFIIKGESDLSSHVSTTRFPSGLCAFHIM